MKISLKIILTLILSFFAQITFTQVEHVHIKHPVYDFLLRAENKGYMENNSLASLPLQRKEIIEVLRGLDENKSKLSSNELKVLKIYLDEFDNSERAVWVYSESDKNQIFFSNLIGDDEKYIYHYMDSVHSVSLKPVGNLDFRYKEFDDGTKNAILANGGLRLYGTLSKRFGYYLQVTNGSQLSGEKSLTLEDGKYRGNIKFDELDSDFDFTESHLRFDYDWFYAYVGRETRVLGAGLNYRAFLSDLAPPMDAFAFGAKFRTFEYRYTHSSLLSVYDSIVGVGFNAQIPQKYSAMHRFSFRPSWGEFSFWEQLIYSNRDYDIAYLNPLSFFKSLEHALRDRDNSIIGLDMTLRPWDNIQIKSSFLLDDLIFSEIGTGYWSNKAAYNIAVISSLPFDLDVGLEYAKVEPYTFTHFNPHNTVTNDSVLIAGDLLPNSDRLSAKLQYWWGGRYPIKLDISYMRHGSNIYDSDSLYYNAGGELFDGHRHPQDAYRLDFLSGNVVETLSLNLSAGIELFRGLNFHIFYTLRQDHENETGKSGSNNYIRANLSFYEF